MVGRLAFDRQGRGSRVRLVCLELHEGLDDRGPLGNRHPREAQAHGLVPPAIQDHFEIAAADGNAS
jgi:hypothetical protein